MHNEVLLTRDMLHLVLNDLSQRLLYYFGTTVDIVVHGGVVMVLHPRLASRQSTRDVDYNHRSFVREWAKRGIHDADQRLKTCIAATAQAYKLGADWMNACADVALPMSKEYVLQSCRYVDVTTHGGWTLLYHVACTGTPMTRFIQTL